LKKYSINITFIHVFRGFGLGLISEIDKYNELKTKRSDSNDEIERTQFYDEMKITLSKIYNLYIEINENESSFFEDFLGSTDEISVDLKIKIINEWGYEESENFLKNWTFLFEHEKYYQVKCKLIDFLVDYEEHFISYFENKYTIQQNEVKSHILEKIKDFELDKIETIIDQAFSGNKNILLKIEQIIINKIQDQQVCSLLKNFILKLISLHRLNVIYTLQKLEFDDISDIFEILDKQENKIIREKLYQMILDREPAYDFKNIAPIFDHFTSEKKFQPILRQILNKYSLNDIYEIFISLINQDVKNGYELIKLIKKWKFNDDSELFLKIFINLFEKNDKRLIHDFLLKCKEENLSNFLFEGNNFPIIYPHFLKILFEDKGKVEIIFQIIKNAPKKKYDFKYLNLLIEIWNLSDNQIHKEIREKISLISFHILEIIHSILNNEYQINFFLLSQNEQIIFNPAHTINDFFPFALKIDNEDELSINIRNLDYFISFTKEKLRFGKKKRKNALDYNLDFYYSKKGIQYSYDSDSLYSIICASKLRHFRNFYMHKGPQDYITQIIKEEKINRVQKLLIEENLKMDDFQNIWQLNLEYYFDFLKSLYETLKTVQ